MYQTVLFSNRPRSGQLEGGQDFVLVLRLHLLSDHADDGLVAAAVRSHSPRGRSIQSSAQTSSTSSTTVTSSSSQGLQGPDFGALGNGGQVQAGPVFGSGGS